VPREGEIERLREAGEIEIERETVV